MAALQILVRWKDAGKPDPIIKGRYDRPEGDGDDWEPVLGSRTGGFQRKVGEQWEYWYPGHHNGTTYHSWDDPETGKGTVSGYPSVGDRYFAADEVEDGVKALKEELSVVLDKIDF